MNNHPTHPNAPHPDPAPLSSVGHRRKQAILALALAQAHSRAAHRRTKKIQLASAAILLITITTLVIHCPPNSQTTPVQLTTPLPFPPTTVPPVKPTREITIQYIQTDPTLATTLALPTTPPTWQKIPDETLLNQLAESGHPAALAWINNHPVLLLEKSRD